MTAGGRGGTDLEQDAGKVGGAAQIDAAAEALEGALHSGQVRGLPAYFLLLSTGHGVRRARCEDTWKERSVLACVQKRYMTGTAYTGLHSTW